jgi:DNA topoisomerase-2
VKKTPHEHVLTRPDSYVGSIELSTADIWVYDDVVGMNKRKVNYVPGLYKIFDEILVNAADHKQRDPSMNIIKVEIDPENNLIQVYNNGDGIPVQMHSEEKIWIPEMIFGHLLTSSNYDDNEKKVTGGRNGYGAKLANIFSTEFSVETLDTNAHKKYKQTWTENMYKAGKASITKSSVKRGYTQISFKPDLAKFGMEHLDKDIVALMSKRVYDIAGCNSSVKVYLNGSLIPIRNFTAYCKLYLPKDQKCVFDKINDRWEVCVTHSEGEAEQVSFVNSINTIRGGTHVQTIQDRIAKHIIEQVKKKQKKGPVVKPHQVKQQTWIFVNCLIENPTFDPQTQS